MTIKLIVGLANPGKEYSETRHNIGSWYVNLLSEKFRAPLYRQSKFFGFTSHINIANNNINLLIPTTFVNLSGKSVKAISSFYHINPNEILVAHDELDLPPGIAKFKFGGGHNGHNGLKNIINHLGNNQNFYRLRFGIGHPGDKNKVISLVLTKPIFSEQKVINKAIKEAVFCTEIWLKENFDKAINRLHAFKPIN